VQALVERAGQISGRAGAFELNDQATAEGTVDQTVEGVRRVTYAAANAARNVAQGVNRVRAEAFAQVAGDIIDPPTNDFARETEESSGVFGCLDDRAVVAEQQQGSVWLYRSGEMDRFAFTVR
jgi:uncharacterized protein YdbL (DUF1318 family)